MIGVCKAMQDRKRQKIGVVQELAEEGFTPEEIAEGVELSVYTVKQYLNELGLDWIYKQTDKLSVTEKVAQAVRRADVDRFRESLKPGNRVMVTSEVLEGYRITRKLQPATVKAVSNHVILTDKGCFQDKEVYLWSGQRKSQE